MRRRSNVQERPLHRRDREHHPGLHARDAIVRQRPLGGPRRRRNRRGPAQGRLLVRGGGRTAAAPDAGAAPAPAAVAPLNREPSPASAEPEARPPPAHHEETARPGGQRQRLRGRQHGADRRPHDVRPVPGAVRQPLLQPRLHPEALLLLAEPLLLLDSL